MARDMPPDPTRCAACPRLVAWRDARRAASPSDHNAPVPPSGPLDAPILLVGLAPGPRGANRTGRPFEGDRSGDLLFGALYALGLAALPTGQPTGVRVTNAVRCLPPDNRPLAVEIATCREAWFAPELRQSPARVVVALGPPSKKYAIQAYCRPRPRRARAARLLPPQPPEHGDGADRRRLPPRRAGLRRHPGRQT